jgi:hypothetical protein
MDWNMSESPIPGEITHLLNRWKIGDREALSSLASLAYPELRAIATGYLRREHAGHTLQATGLVHELYLRLTRIKNIELIDRRHFYTFAAQMSSSVTAMSYPSRLMWRNAQTFRPFFVKSACTSLYSVSNIAYDNPASA